MKIKKHFTGAENHSITTAEALTFIKQFREHYGPEAAPGVFFDKQAVQEILQQPQAVGMRYYYGADALEQTRLVLVGANANGNDLLQGESVKVSMASPPMIEKGLYDQSAVRHEISLHDAAQWTSRYQESLRPGEIKGGFFGKAAVLRLLDYSGCVGIRFFFGAKRDGARVVVGLCVDKFGIDLFYGPMMELSIGCPPICGSLNPLNCGKTSKSERVSSCLA